MGLKPVDVRMGVSPVKPMTGKVGHGRGSGLRFQTGSLVSFKVWFPLLDDFCVYLRWSNR